MDDGVRAVIDAGGTVWLEGAPRPVVGTGRLASLVAAGQVSGVVIEPTTLHQALAEGAYDEAFEAPAAPGPAPGASAEEAVAALVADDVRLAADALADTYRTTGGRDGWVTLTLPPWVSGSTADIVAAAQKATAAVGRPNLLVGVPTTGVGLTAVTELVAAGVGVNAAPAFSPDGYRAVADAYMEGLEKALADGRIEAAGPGVVSVALSPVDTDADKQLWRVGTDDSAALRGRAAIANARRAHAAHDDVTGSARWEALAAAGARPLRLAWTLMGVRDPYYPDTHYVDSLVDLGAVATVPEATLVALGEGDRGLPRADVDATAAAMDAVGVSLADVAGNLQGTGAVARLTYAWDVVRKAVEGRLLPG